MTLLLLLALLGDPEIAAPPPEEETERILLVYQAPEGEGFAPEDVTLPSWEAGTKLFTADAAEMRDGPGAGGRVAGTLPAGSEIEVAARLEAIEVRARRVGQWYRVKAGGREGYLFGGELTPFAFRVDMDGDGADEIATVAYTADFRVRVRVKDGRSGKTGLLDLVPTGGAYISAQGGVVEALLHGPAVAGIPLLEVRSFVEACADYTHRFVSYVPGPGGTAPRMALELAGLTDPPTIASFDVTFDPVARTAKVDNEVTGEDEQGESIVEEKRTERYRLVEGVFVAQ